jgi:hypothetical protein
MWFQCPPPPTEVVTAAPAPSSSRFPAPDQRQPGNPLNDLPLGALTASGVVNAHVVMLNPGGDDALIVPVFPSVSVVEQAPSLSLWAWNVMHAPDTGHYGSALTLPATRS